MANIQLLENRSNLPSSSAPRLNFVAVAAFLAPVLLGGLATLITLNPISAIDQRSVTVMSCRSAKGSAGCPRAGWPTICWAGGKFRA